MVAGGVVGHRRYVDAERMGGGWTDGRPSGRNGVKLTVVENGRRMTSLGLMVVFEDCLVLLLWWWLLVL